MNIFKKIKFSFFEIKALNSKSLIVTFRGETEESDSH